MLVAVHLAPRLAGRGFGEARIADHHGLHIGGERSIITGGVSASEIGLAGPGFALVDTVEGAAVADEVLGRGKDRGWRAEPPLQPANHGFAIAADQRRIGAVAFVAAAPARVLNDREGWSERPAESRRAHLLRRRMADPLHQRGIVRGAEPDIVRE